MKLSREVSIGVLPILCCLWFQGWNDNSEHICFKWNGEDSSEFLSLRLFDTTSLLVGPTNIMGQMDIEMLRKIGCFFER